MKQKTEASQAVEEREKFETWANPPSYWWNGTTYSDLHTQIAWEAWQARAALKAQPAPTEAWTKQAPTVQADYWHWNGDEDAAPSIVSVLYSSSARKCFVTMNCTYSGQAEMCDKYGGWWMRIEQPGLPGNEAQPSGNTGELAQGEDSARMDDLATIRGLDKIGMEFAARLAQMGTTTVKGRDYLYREDVMIAVTDWRSAWDRNSKARKPIDRARASAETGGVMP